MRAATTKAPYLSNQVRYPTDEPRDPFYQLAIDSTLGNLAIPIFDIIAGADEDLGSDAERKLLGVLDLEARSVGAFSPAIIAELEASASELVSDMKLFQLARNPQSMTIWHPDAMGWSLRPVWDDFCHAISKSIPNGQPEATVGCTIWCFDEIKKYLYALGTVRFDYEYISRQILPYKSPTNTFLGSVIDNKPDEVATLDADRFHQLARKEKARRMQVERIKAIPIRARRPDLRLSDLTQKTNGVLAVYFFHHEFGTDSGRASDAFSDYVLARLADYASAIRCQQTETRRLVALAKIESLIRQSPPIAATFMEELKNTLSKIFMADGCTVFVSKTGVKDGKKVLELHPVATTGLVVNDELVIHTEDAIDRCEYPSEAEQAGPKPTWIGLTRFLAFHPRATVRKNDLYHDEEILGGVGEQFKLIPRVAMPEALVPPEIGNHRFLGVSCGPALDDAFRAAPATEVIRLVRTSESPPFSNEDEDLLHEIAAKLTPIFDAVREQRRELDAYMIDDSDLQVICPDSLTANKQNAAKRAARRINTNSSRWMMWNAADLESLLQDLLLMFEASGARRASVRVVSWDETGTERLRLFAHRSKFSMAPPDERKGWPASRRQPNVGWQSLEAQSPVIYHSQTPIREDKSPQNERDKIDWGINLPFRYFVAGHSVDGVLSIDFSKTSLDETRSGELVVRTASKAVRKLGRLTWTSDTQDTVRRFDDRPNTKQDEVFHSVLQEEFSAYNLWLREEGEDPKFSRAENNEFLDAANAEKWLSTFADKHRDQVQPQNELEEYGASIEPHTGLVHFPLYFGMTIVAAVVGFVHPKRYGRDERDWEPPPKEETEVRFRRYSRQLPEWYIDATARLSRVSAAWHAWSCSTDGLRNRWTVSWKREDHKQDKTLTLWHDTVFWNQSGEAEGVDDDDEAALQSGSTEPTPDDAHEHTDERNMDRPES